MIKGYKKENCEGNEQLQNTLTRRVECGKDTEREVIGWKLPITEPFENYL